MGIRRSNRAQGDQRFRASRSESQMDKEFLASLPESVRSRVKSEAGLYKAAVRGCPEGGSYPFTLDCVYPHVEEHLGGCERCKHRLEELRAERARLDDAYKRLEQKPNS
jgi:hypothetical protein